MDFIRIDIGPVKIKLSSQWHELLKHIEHVIPHNIKHIDSSYDYSMDFLPSFKEQYHNLAKTNDQKFIKLSRLAEKNTSLQVAVNEQQRDLDYYTSIGKLTQSVMNSLRAATRIWSVQQGGLLVHSASILLGNGHALLAFGSSGSGKSTLTRLVTKAISEEWSLVFQKKKQWYTCAPPFRLDCLERPGHASLVAGLHLKHAPPSELNALKPQQALAHLLRQCLVPDRLVQSNKENIRNAMQLISDLPFFDFQFRPDDSALKMLNDYFASPN